MSTRICRFRPLTFLPASKPLIPPTSVVLTDWLSRLAADASGSDAGALRLAATDLYLSLMGRIPAEIGKPGSVAVSAKDLFERITIEGSMHNSRGAWQRISRSIEQPLAHWDGEVEARRQYTSNYEPDEMIADELKKLRQATEKINARFVVEGSPDRSETS